MPLLSYTLIVNSVLTSLSATILKPIALPLKVRSSPLRPTSVSKVELPSIPSYWTNVDPLASLGVPIEKAPLFAPALKTKEDPPSIAVKIISLSPPIIPVPESKPNAVWEGGAPVVGSWIITWGLVLTEKLSMVVISSKVIEGVGAAPFPGAPGTISGWSPGNLASVILIKK